MSSELDSWIRERFQSVLTNGLLAGDRFSESDKLLLATDPVPCSRIYGVIVGGYGSSDSIKWHLEEELYRSDESVMPVLAERAGEQNPLLKDGDNRALIEGRIQHSFLAVCSFDEVLPYKNRGHIPISLIRQLAIPQSIYKILIQDPPMLTDPSLVKPVKGYREVKLLWELNQVTVPDYESYIFNLLTTNPETLWIHGGRLPTQEDLDKLTALSSH